MKQAEKEMQKEMQKTYVFLQDFHRLHRERTAALEKKLEDIQSGDRATNTPLASSRSLSGSSSSSSSE
jgi:hypothetical protein